MTGSLAKSTEVMKYMQELVRVPEIQASMHELSREMMKVMGIPNTFFFILPPSFEISQHIVFDISSAYNCFTQRIHA